jgi:predicted amidohydrolase
MAMGGNKLSVACVGFKMSGDIERNWQAMENWTKLAANKGAELVHFPEAALTGYNGVHVKRMDVIDRELLKRRSDDMAALAAAQGVWIAYGTTHFEADGQLPFNSLVLVGPNGAMVSRYDKIFLTDTDRKAYSPGNHLSVARIKNFTVGLTICFDMRFPELFRRLAGVGVSLVLLSGYQCGGPRAEHMRSVAPSTLITRASENGICLSASNTSESPAWHESMVIRFNGDLLAAAPRHTPGMALTTLDATDSEPFTDFIRATARRVADGSHPQLDRPLGAG